VVKDLTVVVPTFNEEGNIGRLIEEISKCLCGVNFEILVVDDCSTDGTVKIVEEYFRKGFPVRVIVKPRRTGKPESVIIGIRSAEGRYIAFIDADFEYPPEILRKMWDVVEFEDADIVLARRIQRKRSLYRRIISGGARFLAKLLFPELRSLEDPTTECLIVRTDLARSVDLKPYIKPFLALLVKILRECKGLRKVEVPCELRCREYGSSSFNVRWIFNYVRELLELSNWFPVRYIVIALVLALVSVLVSPYIGVFALLASVAARTAIFFKEVKIYGIPLAEAASTLLKHVLYMVLKYFWIFGWAIAAVTELVLVHVFRK